MNRAPVFLVFGQPRSGGNLTAGILHRLGVSMGTEFRPGNDWNPEWYEDLEFDVIIRRLMGADPAPVKVAGPVRTLPHDDELAALIAARQALGTPWGLKNIHLPLVLEQFATALGSDLKPIVTTREFSESVDSYLARSGITLAEAKERVSDPLYAAGSAARHYGLKPLVVDFAELVVDPAGQVKRIADYAGLPVTQAAIDWVQPALKRFGGAKA